MPPDVPHVESFIVRFIENRSAPDRPEALPDWRGVIVHVQTNESKGFTELADAIAFMARYVCIGDFAFPESPTLPTDRKDSNRGPGYRPRKGGDLTPKT